MAVLYRTGQWAAAHRNPLLSDALELHRVLAVLLFAMAVCRLDPVRGRCGLPLRAVTLLTAGAAHAVLAKGLYAAGPPGTSFAADDLRAGAQLMYYGGDAVEVFLRPGPRRAVVRGHRTAPGTAGGPGSRPAGAH
ncbi:cytochrome c oxidase assembly protein [Streptomyces albogriseolus]|uniref:cytochrome c oxidase assembly protein n=1 Tax=Streptomyces albogriseolus TaxID=1887 RepID=UPI0033A7B467